MVMVMSVAMDVAIGCVMVVVVVMVMMIVIMGMVGIEGDNKKWLLLSFPRPKIWKLLIRRGLFRGLIRGRVESPAGCLENS